MPQLFLVRHGKAAAGFDAHPDPGLDPAGLQQAEAFARAFAARRADAKAPALPILTSPLRRTQETALPLARSWSSGAVVEARVAELPSPPGIALAARGPWIREVLQGEWGSADDALRRWRDSLLEALLALRQDVVVFTHFIAINVVIGAATGSDRILVSRPDHCSCTELEADGGTLRLRAEGRQLDTQIL